MLHRSWFSSVFPDNEPFIKHRHTDRSAADNFAEESRCALTRERSMPAAVATIPRPPYSLETIISLDLTTYQQSDCLQGQKCDWDQELRKRAGMETNT
jgi:hypothetical protein